ncbi:MAG: 4Fe-4S binding protein [Desulfohalobiaceae bacterium]|nr:4Fe-4S binding protein [Desulfohalobiaceae bacterium]
MSKTEHCIVYCSPAGSMRKVSEAVEARLRESGQSVALFDLARTAPRDVPHFFSGYSGARCLWVGTPVYAQHPVPPVLQFLEHLPEASGQGAAVPFVTWGAVSSGVALPEMTDTLLAKGYSLPGAAKVVAEHSSMWRSESPLGEGRPGEGDLAEVRKLADSVLQKLDSGEWQPLPRRQLDYQPEWLKERAAAMNIERLKEFHPGYTLEESLCTQCGICEQECPAGAIKLDPYPRRDDSCFLCNNCARFCPEGAMHIDTSSIEKRVREMAQQNPEPKETAIFF